MNVSLNFSVRGGGWGDTRDKYNDSDSVWYDIVALITLRCTFLLCIRHDDADVKHWATDLFLEDQVQEDFDLLIADRWVEVVMDPEWDCRAAPPTSRSS